MGAQGLAPISLRGILRAGCAGKMGFGSDVIEQMFTIFGLWILHWPSIEGFGLDITINV